MLSFAPKSKAKPRDTAAAVTHRAWMGKAAGRNEAPRRHTASRQRHDFGHVSIYPRVEYRFEVTDKSVNGMAEDRYGLVDKKGPDAGVAPPDAGAPSPAPAPTPAPAPVPKPAAPAARAKKAGVDSFKVAWTKNPASGPNVAKFLLIYPVKLKKDATHDPTLAEFRQNAFHTFSVTAGPDKGQKNDTSPLHDDHYSRADDTGGNAADDVDFTSNDNPGASPLNKDDVIDFSFTAEQMIIDTSDSNKVIAKRGPHTATITGKDPRAYDGVPTTLT